VTAVKAFIFSDEILTQKSVSSVRLKTLQCVLTIERNRMYCKWSPWFM